MCDVDEDDFPDEYVNDVDRTIIQRKRPKQHQTYTLYVGLTFIKPHGSAEKTLVMQTRNIEIDPMLF